MRTLLGGLVVVIILGAAIRTIINHQHRGRSTVAELRDAIGRSELPTDARAAMNALLDQHHLKPSQFS